MRQNLIFVYSDFQRALAPCATSECHQPRVYVRSRAPRSYFTAGLFRLALRTARDVLVFDVVLRVVFLPYSLLRSLLMGGIHNIGSRVENLW